MEYKKKDSIGDDKKVESAWKEYSEDFKDSGLEVDLTKKDFESMYKNVGQEGGGFASVDIKDKEISLVKEYDKDMVMLEKVNKWFSENPSSGFKNMEESKNYYATMDTRKEYEKQKKIIMQKWKKKQSRAKPGTAGKGRGMREFFTPESEILKIKEKISKTNI